MSKRSADTFAGHESVPPGALPFFVPGAKRVRSGRGCPPSPSDPLMLQSANSSSSDEINDAGMADQADAVSAHHLTTAPSCSSAAWPGNAGFNTFGVVDCLNVLGIQTPPHCPDARLFLEQLITCMLGCQNGGSVGLAASSTAAGSLGTALWHAFAELNVVLARHFSELPTSMLRGYHSFTRAPRAQLWHRFAASQGAEMSEEHHTAMGCCGMQRWLVLTRFLLEHVLAGCPTASCVMYTIEVPAWLYGWCARWGHPGNNAPLRVLALFAYEAAGAPSPRALYVPCIELAGF
ncbi:hypothetical protein PLESTB_000021900 [Pleodorina starrii]|uniref:Uncharacterized protein n=1 Tax=Pleodorina starrii TaxID=330485 RepID=A0A9W6B9X1_9CHLO|nr:hypothetical protein PLESTM_001112900 [Pleodorina starrii]GLC47752.1 hypothetical protein PLESTB_000021900 [Pleodorina starrii]GLC70834.1 hypothetical protein PLESTF_001038100 [Pleodorina starrii]